jgi:hypothetical protein
MFRSRRFTTEDPMALQQLDREGALVLAIGWIVALALTLT